MVYWSNPDHDVAKRAYYEGGLAAAYRACPNRTKQSVYSHLVYTQVHVRPPMHESASRRWEWHEDQVLFKYYETLGAAGILQRNLLVGRTRLAITKRAAILGLAREGHKLADAWSKIATAKLRKFAQAEARGEPRNSEALLAAFPGRTLSAIVQKLQTIKQRPKGKERRRAFPRKWSSEEDDFVRQNYLKLGAKKVAEILGRSVAAVTNRAYDLGVTRTKSKEITNN